MASLPLNVVEFHLSRGGCDVDDRQTLRFVQWLGYTGKILDTLFFWGVFIVGLVLGPARFLLWICLQNRYARFGWWLMTFLFRCVDFGQIKLTLVTWPQKIVSIKNYLFVQRNCNLVKHILPFAQSILKSLKTVGISEKKREDEAIDQWLLRAEVLDIQLWVGIDDPTWSRRSTPGRIALYKCVHEALIIKTFQVSK